MHSLNRCPTCNCELAPDCSQCPECQGPIVSADSARGAKNPWSFSLAELLIGTTYICILLAVTLAAPEWGAFLWIASAFALARTIWFSVAWKRAQRPLTPLTQIGSFAESLVVMGLISAAATVAFLGTCLPLGMTVMRCCSPSHSEFLAACAWVIGGAAGLASGGFLLWQLWIRPVVTWWRVGQPPTMLSRIATLGRSLVLLSSTMLASGLAAMAAGWSWMLSLGARLEQRDERTSRIVFYFILVAGYLTGGILGIGLGRRMAAAIRTWFWPTLVPGALATAVLIVLASRVLPTPWQDDSGVSASLAGMFAALLIGMVIHRVLSPPNPSAGGPHPPQNDGKRL